MKKSLYAILAIALIIGFAFIIRKQANPSDQSQIIIGAPLSLTGTAATDGLSIKRGIDLAVDDLARQGVNVKVIYQDDATDPKQTISAVNSIMTANPRVDALVGPTWSFLLDAAASTIDQRQVVSYSPANTSEFIQSKSPYLFFGAVKNAYRLEPMTEWLTKMNAHRVALVIDKSAWGESNLIPIKAAIEKGGGTVVLFEEVPYGSERDTYPTILAQLKTIHPDAIVVTGYDNGFTILINKVHELGIHTPILMASTLPAGLVANDLVKVSPNDEMYYMLTKTSEEFSQKFFQKYGMYPQTYSDSAYDGVMLVVQAIENGPANMSLQEYMKSSDFHYAGYQTNYSFDGNGDIKGGEWIVKKLI